ncbi:MAG TPA: hypothetical protein VFM88_10980, partial [Vicinamibacteria bacterium]|nr:hypothetical protein [Vicinamibacteria bacterium]
MEATLALELAAASTACPAEVLLHDLVEELGDAASFGPRGFLEARLQGRRYAPSVDLALACHALQSNASACFRQPLPLGSPQLGPGRDRMIAPASFIQ